MQVCLIKRNFINLNFSNAFVRFALISKVTTTVASRTASSSIVNGIGRNETCKQYPPAAAPSSATIAQSTSSARVSHIDVDEYPQTVQELVMNGFELSKVLHAYDLVGNNFDDLLCFLMSSER